MILMNFKKYCAYNPKNRSLMSLYIDTVENISLYNAYNRGIDFGINIHNPTSSTIDMSRIKITLTLPNIHCKSNNEILNLPNDDIMLEAHSLNELWPHA